MAANHWPTTLLHLFADSLCFITPSTTFFLQSTYISPCFNKHHPWAVGPGAYELSLSSLKHVFPIGSLWSDPPTGRLRHEDGDPVAHRLAAHRALRHAPGAAFAAAQMATPEKHLGSWPGVQPFQPEITWGLIRHYKTILESKCNHLAIWIQLGDSQPFKMLILVVG